MLTGEMRLGSDELRTWMFLEQWPAGALCLVALMHPKSAGRRHGSEIVALFKRHEKEDVVNYDCRASAVLSPSGRK